MLAAAAPIHCCICIALNHCATICADAEGIAAGDDAKLPAGDMLPALACAEGDGEAEGVVAEGRAAAARVAQPPVAVPCLSERCMACWPRACSHSR
mmetsp:Transcript_93121/g.263553  ORF Transcript_93121/g.263553 Transcript_93121/m.263553 type:complete len:96 (+) Transcript_93121:268-555(+)